MNMNFGCEINSCESFQIGIIVNSAFYLLSFIPLVFTRPYTEYNSKICEEFHQHRRLFGYTLYLIAGCAFFGNYFIHDFNPLPDQRNFASWWRITFLFLIFGELYIGLRYEPSPDIKHPARTIMKIASVISGTLAIYLVWIGGVYTSPIG